ncbi:MAG: hypothetical protein WEC59_13570 [Salibacteraceae bacterium]
MGGFAQEGVLPLEHFITTKAEISMKDSAHNIHSALKPYSFWTIQKYAEPKDSLGNVNNLALRRSGASYITLSPRIDATAFNQAGSSFNQGVQALGGIGVGAGWKNIVYVHVDGVVGRSNFPDYMKRITDSLSVVPGFGYASGESVNGDAYDFDQLSAVIAVKPSEYFELFAGRGRHFIGEGYRSMFLSDVSSNYNYLRTDVNIWKLKYMVLYAQMNQANDYPSRYYPQNTKYSTMHYLSLNLTKWWTVGAFESVVWEREDSVVNRSFDVNYLNPLIFFRPVEYGIGSSDNSLIGFSSSIRPISGLTLYGQFLLDEMVVGEWAAPVRKLVLNDSTIKTGWWANKQSYQLGVKYHEPLGWKNASVLAEINVVRPFTYGHSNRLQSYTHANQPLAHPLGANFIEWVQITTWQPGRFQVGLFTTYSRKGYSYQPTYFGEDILVSNKERDENNREHGNFLLQGKRVDVANIRLNLGYTLIKNWNLKTEAILHYRLERDQVKTTDMVFIGLGIRTALWNDYRNL